MTLEKSSVYIVWITKYITYFQRNPKRSKRTGWSFLEVTATLSTKKFILIK